MAAYAERTTVPVSKSIAELDALVTKHGATGFGYARDMTASDKTRVQFRIADRMVRFEVKKPDPADYRMTGTYRTRSVPQMQQLADAEERRRWRGLVLVVKALLVGVSDGVITLSEAFLPYTLLPGDQTVGEWAAEQLDYVYASGQMPAALPGAASARKELPAGADRGLLSE